MFGLVFMERRLLWKETKNGSRRRLTIRRMERPPFFESLPARDLVRFLAKHGGVRDPHTPILSGGLS